jgi:hypothetical protein
MVRLTFQNLMSCTDTKEGYAQCGETFQIKTRRLERAITNMFAQSKRYPASVEYCYPSGPVSMRPGDNEEGGPLFHAWCESNVLSQNAHIDRGLDALAETILREGPFDGVIGFSQGAAAAGFVASLLETARKTAFDKHAKLYCGMPYSFKFMQQSSSKPIQKPLKFIVTYAGTHASNKMYDAFYNPKIATPLLQIIGKYDTFIEESACLQFAARFRGPKMIRYHAGAHFVPTETEELDAVLEFLRMTLMMDKTACEKAHVEHHEYQITPSLSSRSSSDSSSGSGRLRWRRSIKRGGDVVRYFR